MKKVFAVLAAASMFAFVACGGGDTAPEGTSDSTQVVNQPEPEVTTPETSAGDTTTSTNDTTSVTNDTTKVK